MSWRRSWPLLLPIVALGELCLHAFFARRAPAFEAYAQAIPALDALRQEGDLVVMAPAWAEPMLRRAAGDARLPLSAVARPDEIGAAQAIEVSIFGARDEALASWRELEVREVGPFLLRKLDNPDHQPIRFDFVDGLFATTTMVAIEGRHCAVREVRPSAGGLGGHPTFPPLRHQCPDSPFLHASVTVIADERFRPRRCIWAHPPPQGELSITQRGIFLGERIFGHGGLYWVIERERRGAPITLRVTVDGHEVGRYVHADGDGWSGFDFPLGPQAGKQDAEVTFAVSAPDHRHRHFCFEARTR